MKRCVKDLPSEKISEGISSLDCYCLVLFNDDVNSYDYVVESLIEICKHDPIQAEQCTFIAHHKGKCDIKNGALDFLEPMKQEFSRRGISTVISVN